MFDLYAFDVFCYREAFTYVNFFAVDNYPSVFVVVIGRTVTMEFGTRPAVTSLDCVDAGALPSPAPQSPITTPSPDTPIPLDSFSLFYYMIYWYTDSTVAPAL